MASKFCAPLLMLFFALFSCAVSARFHSDVKDSSDTTCVYTVYVRTGSIIKGGTESNISLTLYDSYGNGVYFDNLVTWGGLMPLGYDYFGRGNLAIFSGRGVCLASAMCKMVLTSDGTGPHAGWYVNYVETTITGVHMGCSQNKFTVEQWLGLDVYPYQLTAVRDTCVTSVSSSAKSS